MRLTNLNPTETSLGASHQRDDFLEQEARNSGVARRVRTLARVALVLLVVVVVTVIAVRPGRAIDWVGNYLIPVGVITGVIIASLALLVWAVKRLPNPPYRNWWQ